MKEASVDRLVHMLERLLSLLLLGMFLMIATLVMLRYGFATTIIGGNEATIVAFIYTTAIGASIALLRDEHVAVSYFVEMLPPKLQDQLLQLRLVLLCVLNALIFAYSLWWIRDTGGFLMPALGAPQIVVQLSIPLGCGLAVIFCVVRLLRK